MFYQKSLFVGAFRTEPELLSLIAPLYPQLWRMIREPFDDLSRRRSEDHAFRILEEGECAQWLRPQIVAKAKDMFSDRADVLVEKRKSQLLIKYRDQVAITPKKFRHSWASGELTFSTYETRQNKAYWRQQPLEGFEDIPRIIVGYQFINELTDIRILVGYPKGRRLQFCSLLPDQSGVVVSHMDTELQSADKPGYEVRPRKGSRKSGAAQ